MSGAGDAVSFAKVGGPPADWDQYRIFDAKTGEEIRDVIEVDTTRGYLLRYQRDENSRYMLTPCRTQVQVEHMTGEFRLVRQ